MRAEGQDGSAASSGLERGPRSPGPIHIGVVIPFFQRQPGLLRRTLESVCGQNCLPQVHLHVVVVDDESPQPADEDLQGLALPQGVALTLIKQANGGPGVARNTALDSFGADIDYVAFVDSDDVWAPGHLSGALSAFGAGVDLFFSDHHREDLFGSYLADQQSKLDEMTQPAGASADLLVVKPDKSGIFMLQVVPATSTVAYRWSGNARLRFKPHLRTAGEDHVFLLELVAAGATVGVSKANTVLCGKGVNIYFDSLSWDQPACLSRLAYRLNSFRLLRDILARHDHDARAFIAQKTVTLERLVALVAARGVAKRIPGFAPRVHEVAKSEPHFWWWTPKRLVEVGFLKMAGRFQLGNE